MPDDIVMRVMQADDTSYDKLPENDLVRFPACSRSNVQPRERIDAHNGNWSRKKGASGRGLDAAEILTAVTLATGHHEVTCRRLFVQLPGPEPCGTNMFVAPLLLKLCDVVPISPLLALPAKVVAHRVFLSHSV